ncbi:MAG: hypothetical protein AAGA08_02675 [Pseudomonadota bacterium]
MTMAHDITQEDLTAYLDGEASDALVTRIEAELGQNAELQARLAGLELDTAAMRVAAEPLLADAPQGLVPQPQASRQSKTGWAIAASLIIGLGAGYLLFAKPASDKPDWMAYVAAYQALYVPETLARLDDTAQTDFSYLSDQIGRDLSPAAQANNLDFKRGQVLGFEDTALIQLAYADASGGPVALCIIRNTSAPQGLTLTEMEGMQAASWSDGTHAYLLIGGQDADLIAQSAADFKARM